jgi:hypothetical protein
MYGLPSMLIAPIQAADINPSGIKTIHIKLHLNESDNKWGKAIELFLFTGCPSSPLPPPPATFSFFKDPGNVVTFFDSDTDIYWSGTRLATYTKGTKYSLKMPECTWEIGQVEVGEIIDYTTRTRYAIDFGRQRVKQSTVAPLGRTSDAFYQSMVKGKAVIAGQHCDIIVLPGAKDGDNQCVLSKLHFFPNTNKFIQLRFLWQAHFHEPGNGHEHANGSDLRRVEEATLFEVNVPIAEEKFTLPPGFAVQKH